MKLLREESGDVDVAPNYGLTMTRREDSSELKHSGIFDPEFLTSGDDAVQA